MNAKPFLGTGCPIDVEKLIESRMALCANSGGGKSWAIRVLAEQTYGHVQQIIIDHDGEYHTLREKLDYVLVGQKGDCAASIKTAALLARRLLELNASAIIDIYELGLQRAEFVKRFLDAIVNSPRELWHPVLVIVDEAHLYAPEVGSTVSSDAVKNLMALGRKRGFGCVLATQRIAKLDKDALAEANNKLIGRCALDVDMKRAAAELGFSTREDMLSLRDLKPGEFYAFGPALLPKVTKIKVGAVQTTHLKAGQRAAPPMPARDRIKKVLAQLADLPHEAEEEAKTTDQLRTRIRQLELELKAKPAAVAPTVIEKQVINSKDLSKLEALVSQVRNTADQLKTSGDSLSSAIAKAQPSKTRYPALEEANRRASKMVQEAVTAIAARTGSELEAALPIGEAAILRALIQYPTGLAKKQLTVMTGYRRSTRDAYIQRLREKGLVADNGDRVFATENGQTAIPDAEPLPTGRQLQAFWQHKLPVGEWQILKLLIDQHPSPVDKQAIDAVTGFKRSTRDAYLQRLHAKELVIDTSRGEVRANDTLF